MAQERVESNLKIGRGRGSPARHYAARKCDEMSEMLGLFVEAPKELQHSRLKKSN